MFGAEDQVDVELRKRLRHGEHLSRPFRADGKIGGSSKPRPLAWASLDRPFGAQSAAL
jgi:hypothetical protein